MSNLFDDLNKKLEAEDSSGGISILHLQDLPTALRKIMRLMLRETQLTYGEILEVLADLPEDERLSQQELDDALYTLTEQFWLIKLGEQNISYRVNLRAKPGSNLGAGIWSAIDDKISGT